MNGKVIQLNPPALAELLESESPLLLDARDAASYQAGHLEGAMLLHDGLLKALLAKKELERPIVVYCYRGQTSIEKAKLFSSAGFQRVYSLCGGFVDWKSFLAKRASATRTPSDDSSTQPA